MGKGVQREERWRGKRAGEMSEGTMLPPLLSPGTFGGFPLWSLKEIHSSGPAVRWLPVICFRGVLPPVAHSSMVRMKADICRMPADRAQRPF